MVEKQMGFTLTEMLIVLTIIGILSSVGYTSYRQYMIRNNRIAMMAELQIIAQKIETKRIEKSAYTNITRDEVMAKTTFPYTGNPLYTLSLAPVDDKGKLTSSEWTLTATPIPVALMQKDGTLSYMSEGIRCRQISIKVCGKGQEWLN